MERADNWDGFARGKYNWKELSDGHVWVAQHGEDFTCTTESFRSVLSHYARRHNLTVEVHVEREIVRFKFSKPEKV